MFSGRLSFVSLLRRHPRTAPVILIVLVCSLMLLPTGQPTATEGQQFAYIGPGAGIALVGSFLAVLFALVSAMFALLTWPLRWIYRAIRSRRALAKAKKKRVVILGLDGLDPDLVEEFLAEGLLPNLARLKEQGSYRRLQTTWPPLSPVAWSSFSTGTNPGKHNIFDFIARDPATYRPAISSVQIGQPRRVLKFGGYQFPLSSTPIHGLRKSKPFWNVLGEAGIFSSVLRVPITFPPDRFHGVQLSAMCVPDLRGTQGTFNYFVEKGESGATADGDVGGEKIIVERQGKVITGKIPGPINPIRTDQKETTVPFRANIINDNECELEFGGKKHRLKCEAYSEWLKIDFKMGFGVKVQGICRFMLKRTNPDFEMYCTPINISPEKPVMPISHPKVFSIYLAKLFGSFSTLGMAEDTWSLSEGVNDEDEFLTQAYDIDEERKQMFFDSLKRVRSGMVACVFDAPDRIQHMFWRFREANHPAIPDDQNTIQRHQDTIKDLYCRMDKLVGETQAAVDENTALFVMSDHGFKSFQRGVDLNAWLLHNGYLSLKNDAKVSQKTYLSDVDWSRTRAYAIGLAGIFINLKDREAKGIVNNGSEKTALVKELCGKLSGLHDEHRDTIAIHEAVSSSSVYKGPYVDSAPDIIIGYTNGYRVSWDAAVGKCSDSIISDNKKAWSGDHCIHPDLVPGILFSNLKLEKSVANIIDLAPTTLDLLGVDKPAYMEGTSLCS